MGTKQSAVEWLVEQIKEDSNLRLRGFDIDGIGKQAKEMEKQQIIKAHFQGVKETVLDLSQHISIPKTLKTIEEIENGIGKHEEGEDYYNEQFKNK
jgi:hypothetical protein